MKPHLLIATILLCISCTPNGIKERDERSKSKVAPARLTAIWMDHAKNNPDIFNNDLSRELAAEKFQKILIDSIHNNPSILYECPVRYMMMYQLSEDEYILKFAAYSLNDANISYKDDDIIYDVPFDLFSIADKETAITLKDSEMYNIVGGDFEGSVNDQHILLRNNTPLEQFPSVSNYTHGSSEERKLNIGGLYISNIEFEEYDKQR